MHKIEYIFRPVDGHFFCMTFYYPLEINDALNFLRLHIDDDCQFCRIKRDGTSYEYRRYNNSKIILTVYEQNP